VFKLVLAQQPVVYKDIGQAVAYGAMHQGRRYRGIDSSTEGANRVPVADLLSNRLDGLFDKSRAAPLGLRFANFKKKISEDCGSLLGVLDLGVKLDRVNLFFRALDRGNRVFRHSS